MSSVNETTRRESLQHLRNWFAESLGVGSERKEEIYIEIARSASLRDVSYWLQVLFSAGIATLGLVLDSPAVIIGAMLISPLMGPILANGLALAAGDLLLGMRAIVSLSLSCAVAILIAMSLVYLLPFKDQTSEIAARAHPNTLDLIVALFSGAVGSVAICKKVKGVVTSIPGVAIAVALMPPLCVVGFGLGVAISAGGVDGMKTARGGALLFLTNLVAITFTAMLVFLALHIDTDSVKEKVREWRSEGGIADIWLRDIFNRLPRVERLKKAGSLPGRILLILAIILLIFIPLSRSFSQLRSEIAQKKSENRIRQVVTEVWEQSFARLPDGSQRSYLGQLLMSDTAGQLTLQMRVFTVKPLNGNERVEYQGMVAKRLNRPPGSVITQLIEIPTASSELLTKANEASKETSRPETLMTIAQLQEEFTKGLDTSLGTLLMPPPAQFVDVEAVVRSGAPSRLRLFYLSSREMEMDAKNLVAETVKIQFGDPDAQVSLERIEDSFGPLAFARNQATVSKSTITTLERVAQVLRDQPKLQAEIVTTADPNEREGIAKEREQALTEFLTSNFQIPPGRITNGAAIDEQRGTILRIKSGAVQK